MYGLLPSGNVIVFGGLRLKLGSKNVLFVADHALNVQVELLFYSSQSYLALKICTCSRSSLVLVVALTFKNGGILVKNIA